MSETASPKQVLSEHGLFPKHHFGQNFLLDPNINSKICGLVQGAEPAQGVVEIGAGLGALTGGLLALGLSVTAIERDRDLIPILEQRFADALGKEQLRVLEADAKTAAYETLLSALPAPRVLAGNLPYQLTGPLLRRTCELSKVISRAVFLVQLEVADRLAAAPASKDYGALTVFAQAAYTVKRAFVVRRGAFYPQPNVDSAVVVLSPHVTAIADEDETFRRLVQSAFQQRRKTLKNAWSGVFGLASSEIADIARAAEIDLSLRGETLSVEDFARMSHACSSRKGGA